MKLFKPVLFSAGAVAAILASGSLTTPKLAAAVKAAYVEVVMPSQAFRQTIFPDDPSQILGFGPDVGKLGVTNITLTNVDTVRHFVRIFKPANPSAGCGNPGSADRASSLADLLVNGNSTLVVPYPTPLVVDSVNGHSCLGLEVDPSGHPGLLSVHVSGFVN